MGRDCFIQLFLQVKHLTQLKYQTIKNKLEPRVSEEIYNAAIASLHPSPTDTCSLFLNLATVAALPVKCSRHNTPSRWVFSVFSPQMDVCFFVVDRTQLLVWCLIRAWESMRVLL